MKAQELVYTIGEKVSYREWNDGIRFYIRSSSRSDTALLKKIGYKALWATAAALAFSIPLFFLHTPYLRWPWLITSLLIWTFAGAACYSYILKKHGMETISIYKGRISYRHLINHPLLSMQLRRNHYALPVIIHANTSADILPNALFPGRKIITSYARLTRSRQTTSLLFHPSLTEQEEMKKRMEDHL